MADREKRREELLANYEGAPIRKTLGMVLSYNENDEAVLDLTHNPGFEHGTRDTHGGIIAALRYDGWITTIEMQVRLLEPARRENLRATGRVLRAGRSFAVAEMEARSSTGRLVATGSGTYTVISPTRAERLGKEEP